MPPGVVMEDDSPFDRDAVDRFYDRQRREILSRLEPAAAARAGHGVRLAGLAAAAVLALGAGVMLRPAPAPAPIESEAAERAAYADALPLAAYGSWPTATELAEETQGTASVAWLFDLAGHDGQAQTRLEDDATDASFLAAYGSWQEADDDVVAVDAT
jgi:hypothetical protein